jgi:hypothetical protein
MLLLGGKGFEVDGVTVGVDHADPNLWWHGPGPVALTRGPDGQAAFTFIKYKPAAVQAGAKGGGFVMFGTDLRLPDTTRAKILAQASGLSPGQAVLEPLPFDEGTVKCVALNLEGAGGTHAQPAPAGAFNAVEQILGATTPSLEGDETAIFSLTLPQEGATILDQAYRQGTGPIGVIYTFKYTAMRPALDVTIEADYESIYQKFSASLEGQYYFLKVGIDAAFEELRKNGIIKITVNNFTGDQDKQDKEKWALDFFKDNLLKDWFQPTLQLGKVSGDDGGGGSILSGVGDVLKAGGASKGDAGGAGKGDAGGADKGAAGGAGKGDAGGAGKGDAGGAGKGDAGGAGKGAAGGAGKGAAGGAGKGDAGGGTAAGKIGAGAIAGAAATAAVDTPGGASPAAIAARIAGAAATAAVSQQAGAAAPVRSPAKLDKTRDPSLPKERDISFTPSSSGVREQLSFTGGGNPSVTVDGKAVTLDASGTLTLDVTPDQPHDVIATYLAVEPAVETFKLKFTFDNPHPEGFSDQPPSPAYQRYLDNRPMPDDPEFKKSRMDDQDQSIGGADALRDWAQKLLSPEVTIDAHASFENKIDSTTIDHNQTLSERRLKVAKGILRGIATVTGGGTATGQDEAKSAGRIGNLDDRAANIHGTTKAGTAGGVIRARLSRAADVVPTPNPKPPPQPNPPPTDKATPPPDKTTPPPTDKATPPPTPNGGNEAIPGAPQVGLKLRFIHQEERKKVKLEYHRAEATQRTCAPQGLFGLMLEDLADTDKHFVEVDLDDPFFRVFSVTIDAPIDFQRIGLVSAHVSLDYGSAADSTHLKHGDFIFDAQNHAQQIWNVFMDSRLDTSYRYGLEYHFDPEADWDADEFSYTYDSRPTEDRSLFLNPFETMSLVEVKVFPNQLDPLLIASTEVHLSWIGDNGQTRERVLSVVPGGPIQTWRVRRRDPTRRDYTARFVHHLKDGTTRETDPTTTTATTLLVDDPFVRPLEIDFLPLFDPSATSMAFVDVRYDDPNNRYHREERIELTGASRAPVHLHVPVLNADRRGISYRITLVGSDNSLKQSSFVETTDTLIGVR